MNFVNFVFLLYYKFMCTLNVKIMSGMILTVGGLTAHQKNIYLYNQMAAFAFFFVFFMYKIYVKYLWGWFLCSFNIRKKKEKNIIYAKYMDMYKNK